MIFSRLILNDENNTYKNNKIDKDGRAGGLAWLGYRLDMAGITRSNRVRPTKISTFLIIILKNFSRLYLIFINYIRCWPNENFKTVTIFSDIVTILFQNLRSKNPFLSVLVIQTVENFQFFSFYLIKSFVLSLLDSFVFLRSHSFSVCERSIYSKYL